MDTLPRRSSEGRRWRRFASSGLAMLLATAGVACADDGESGQPDGAVAPATSDTRIARPFTFDDLGANSSVIMVYPGYGEAAEDRQHNGTFNDGDVVVAICKATGRQVDSVPPEESRSSDQWVGILGSPDEEQYATLTYGDIDPEDFEALPLCD